MVFRYENSGIQVREFQKTSALLTTPKPLTVWIPANCGDNRMCYRKQRPGKQCSGFLYFMTLPSHLNFPVSVSPLNKDNLHLDNLKSPQTMLSFCLWVNFQIQSKLFLYLHTKRYTFHLKVVIKKNSSITCDIHTKNFHPVIAHDIPSLISVDSFI